MMENTVAAFLVALIFGPLILRVLAPAAIHAWKIRAVFGALQVLTGTGLGLFLQAHGLNWPFTFLIALLGLYNLWLARTLWRAAMRTNPSAGK